ncbi:MAG: EamA family transporter, partial [Candidatus Aminicenantia bacterium]
MIEIHIAVFLFGIAGLFGKLLNLSQTIIVFGRVVFASFALFLTLKISRIKLSLNKKMSLFLFFLGILLALHWMAFFHSIKISTVAIALLSYSSFPIFTVFLEPIIFRENFERKNLFLSILAFSGILILIPEFQIKNNITQGVIFGLLSGLTFSILSIFNRKL